MTPSQIIAAQNVTGVERALREQTHVWPRGRGVVSTRSLPPPPPAPAPGEPVRTPPVRVTRDLALDPDANAIGVVVESITESITESTGKSRSTIEAKVLKALSQRAGRWYTVEELCRIANVPRTSITPALTRLVSKNEDVQRVTDGSKSYRYRLLNSLGEVRA